MFRLYSLLGTLLNFTLGSMISMGTIEGYGSNTEKSAAGNAAANVNSTLFPGCLFVSLRWTVDNAESDHVNSWVCGRSCAHDGSRSQQWSELRGGSSVSTPLSRKELWDSSGPNTTSLPSGLSSVGPPSPCLCFYVFIFHSDTSFWALYGIGCRFVVCHLLFSHTGETQGSVPGPRLFSLSIQSLGLVPSFLNSPLEFLFWTPVL